MPPALTVSDMTEENCSERPHQIGDGEPAQGHEQRGLARSEKHSRQDRREVEVEREVVPLDDRGKGRDGERASGNRGMAGRTMGRSHVHSVTR